jgi:DeoR/GlpR family transcriptional regulator of sugar metabolism
MNKDPPTERREAIAGRLAEGRTVSANALAEEFGVSPDAIRRDLRALAAEGRCRRVYGGALPLSGASTSMAIRSAEAAERKTALALAAAGLIQPGEFVFLDNGSTNLALARQLPRLDLTVATNSIAIAVVLAERSDLRIHIIGGTIDAEVGGCVDAAAVLALQQMNIDRCFLGACAVSSVEGVSAFHAADAVFKRVALTCSRRVALMATHDKLGTRARHRVSPVEAINTIVIEHDADDHAETAALRLLGIEIVRAGEPAQLGR